MITILYICGTFALLLVALVLLGVYCRLIELKRWRDEADTTTVRGQATIKACNKEIEKIIGYRFFKWIHKI